MGSRGIVTRLRSRVLEVKLLTGDFAGQKVFIQGSQTNPLRIKLPSNSLEDNFLSDLDLQ